MADLSVTSLTIEELLRKLREREWLIPKFEREFVWNKQDVIDFVHSILCARPIGMATIWEQESDPSFELGPLSLPDRNDPENEARRKDFGNPQANARQVFAVLDGLQRCTAVALVFGGFRTTRGDNVASGRYYLNVGALDPLEQIVFFKEAEVASKHYDNDAACISQGYFPLSSNIPGEAFLGQWFRYLQTIGNPVFYPNGQMPPPDELERRNTVLKKAFEGISRTKLAVYVVPDTYSLPDICEIFEKLNTTGTEVSTVDLIHSWIYADTKDDATGPVQLREWIDDFGQKEGAIGWSDRNDRPELIVQMSTACYVALEVRPQPRRVGKRSDVPIASIKAADLLATPTEHWRQFMATDQQLAGYLHDFQTTVAGGLFPWKWCPYPVMSAIYVALRYHAYFDTPESHRWSIDDLASLFRAFFWRNALTNRYDQGFLTQLGADIKELKRLLNDRRNHNTAALWAAAIEPALSQLIYNPLPSSADLTEYITIGRQTGAIQKALQLPMLAAADKDLLDDTISLRFPQQGSTAQLHHIYPRDWCRNNKTGRLAALLEKSIAHRDWVEAVCNLMPLSRQSNNIWKAKNPGQVLNERQIDFAHSSAILRKVYIDEECFAALQHGADAIGEFWTHRTELIVEDLIERTKITI